MSNWPTNGNLTGKLSIGQGERGKSLEYEWRGTELGIRQEGEEEYQFVNLAGGGNGNSGADGREIELQVNNGFIQWRYVGEESWNNLIELSALEGKQGPKGETGSQGLPGKDGKNGIDGTNGINGQDGANGKDGVTPNITIGTVATLEAGQQATVTREGTNENPIFNFGIPKGNVGDTGKPGEKGVDGINGKSLEFNWNGTELGIKQEGASDYQYVNLKGDKGDKGEQGLPGKDGATPDMSDFEDKINKQYETIEKKIDDHIENHSQGSGNASIDDSTISTDKTWSSSKIEDFIHTNDDVIWSTVQGENLSIDYTKEGYLREVEILGNTTQNQDDLSDIQHLGELYVDDDGREQYKIEIKSSNNLNFAEIFTKAGGFREDEEYIYMDGKEKPFEVKLNWNNYTLYTVSAKGEFVKGNNFGEFSFIYSDGSKASSYVTPLTPFVPKKGNIVKFSWRNSFGVIAKIKKSDFWIYAGAIDSLITKSNKTTLLLPCHLMKVGNVADKLYWDISKGRYMIEKKVDIPEGYDKEIDETLVLQTPQLIETNIKKEIILPSYKDKTHLFVTGGIDGSIKAKAPVDGGKVIGVLQEENIKLKEINKEQDELINTTMLATDEIYSLLEPLLAETLSERSASKMVDMYVAMVQRGIKTIEQVPVRYRDQVKKILDQLEK